VRPRLHELVNASVDDPCGICKKLGHWARDCDQRKEPAKEQADVKTVSCSLVSPTWIYVTGDVNGKAIHCLLDSGSERSAIARSLVPDASLAHSHYSLSAANKMDLPILWDMNLHFTVDGRDFDANVSVSPATDEFLLGSDWLVKNKVKWDFAVGTISFGDKAFHAYRCTFDRVCRCILVSEDCIVLAKHEANVPVKMLDAGTSF